MHRHALIGDVRGRGLMIAVELVRDRATKQPAVQERDELIQACFRRGLLLLGCGRNSIRFCPPLVITEREAQTALAIFENALKEVGQKIEVARESKHIG
jgi:4-aminobutyrate aminotransferase